MIRLSDEVEQLARRVATDRGISVEEAVRLALEEIARSPASRTTGRRSLSRDELLRRMREIVRRSSARPVVDPRSPDELIGYDDYGLPR